MPVVDRTVLSSFPVSLETVPSYSSFPGSELLVIPGRPNHALQPFGPPIRRTEGCAPLVSLSGEWSFKGGFQTLVWVTTGFAEPWRSVRALVNFLASCINTYALHSKIGLLGTCTMPLIAS